MSSFPTISNKIVAGAVALGVAVLAFHPVQWLLQTWTEPAYGSDGALIFAAWTAMLVWSLSSPRRSSDPKDARRALMLLAATTLVRLAGQILAVRMIGAFALIIDVYALGLWLGLHQRKRALAPLGMAALFAMTLPLERMLQRTIGYGLQHISAAGACNVLELTVGDVQCHGMRIIIAGQDVLVDLPCSGARGLLLLMLVFMALATWLRPSRTVLAVGSTIAVLSALASNIVRISLLAVGLAYPAWFGGVDVMAQPWHDIVGFVALAIGGVPLVVWARYVQNARKQSKTNGQSEPGYRSKALSRQKQSKYHTSNRKKSQSWLALLAAGCFVAASLWVIGLSGSPVDVASPSAPPVLPLVLGTTFGEPVPLSAQEQGYFTQYGGGASRMVYGDRALMVVRTSAPLRHLHAPDECMSGAGHHVEHSGLHYGVLPSAVYRSEAPDGQTYRVAVTFVSEHGELATSVAEVTWRWIQDPSVTWSAVQRIAPWEASLASHLAFDRAVAAALDISTHLQKETP